MINLLMFFFRYLKVKLKIFVSVLYFDLYVNYVFFFCFEK
jgi:hypothetical protein